MGRRTKLDDDTQRRICRYIREGLDLATVCELGDITTQTFHGWIRRGEKDEEPFVSFLSAVKHANAIAIRRLVRKIRTAADDPKHWHAAAWILERRFPSRFGRPDLLRLPEGATDAQALEVLERASEAIRRRMADAQQTLAIAQEATRDVEPTTSEPTENPPDDDSPTT